MSKESFGIAGFLQSSSKIYYESIFSQFQIGRITDIFCVIAFENGHHIPHFRTVLHTLLGEACKHQAMLDTATPVFEPVSVEYSSDQERAVFSVSFTFDEQYQKTLDTIAKEIDNTDSPAGIVRHLREVCILATQLIVKIHPRSKRAEITCIISNPRERQIREASPTGIELIQFDGEEPPSSSLNEYVSMGDVDYTVVNSSHGDRAGQTLEVSAKKIIDAAVSNEAKLESQGSHDIEQLLGRGTTQEEIIEALSQSMNREQMAEVIKRNLSPEQVVDLIAKTDPSKIAEILTSELSEEELNELVVGSLSNEMKAHALTETNPQQSAEILKKALSKEEIKKVIVSGTSERGKAKLLADADPEKSARVLQESMTEEEISTVLCDGLPEENQAQILADTLSKKEIGSLLGQSLSDEKRATLVALADPAQAGKILKKTLGIEQINELLENALPDEEKAKALATEMSSEEISKIVMNDLTPAEKARILAQADPGKSAEIITRSLKENELVNILTEQLTEKEQADILAQAMPPEKVSELISKGLSREQKAKLVAQSQPKLAAMLIRENSTAEEVATLLVDALPDGQKAEVLSEGMSEEQISEVIKKSLSEVEKAKTLASSNPEAFAEMVKGALPEEQLAEILKSGLSKEEMAKALVKGMTPEETAKLIKASSNDEELAELISGNIPEEELAQLVKGGMDEEDLAQLVKGSMDEDEFSQLVKGSMNAEELAQVIKGGMTPEKIVETVFSGSSPEEVSRMIKAAMNADQLNDALVSVFHSNPMAIPKEAMAMVAAQTMETDQLKKFAEEGLQNKDLAQTIAAGLSPAQISQITQMSLQSPELSKSLLQALPPQALAQSLAAIISPEKLGKTVMAHLPAKEIAEIISAGLPRQDLAKILTSTLPKEKYASVFIEGLPSQEIARALSEGLPQDKFAKLLSAALSQEQIHSALTDSDFITSDNNVPTFGPTQAVLESSQVDMLMQPDLSSLQALSVLSAILPRQAAESILSGAIPKEDFLRTIESYLPDPELATIIADRVFQLEPAKQAVLSGDFQMVPPPVLPVLNDKRGLATAEKKSDAGLPGVETKKEISEKEVRPEKSKNQQKPALTNTAVPFIGTPDAEKFKEAVESRVAASKKAVEFYLARSRTLETQLRNAEQEKRQARQEADQARLQLEKTLSESESEPQKLKSSSSKAEKPGELQNLSKPSQSDASNDGKNVPTIATLDSPLAQDGEGSPRSETKRHLEKSEIKPRKQTETKDQPTNSAAVDATKIKRDKDKEVNQPEDALAKRQKEALHFFQKKAKTFELDLRKAESEVRRLTTERKADLLRFTKAKDEMELNDSSSEGRARTESPKKAIPETQHRDKNLPTTSHLATEKKEGRTRSSLSSDPTQKIKAQSRVALTEAMESEDDAPSESRSVQILQNKLQVLETKLRGVEAEKQKWIQQYKQELHKAGTSIPPEVEKAEKAGVMPEEEKKSRPVTETEPTRSGALVFNSSKSKGQSERPENTEVEADNSIGVGEAMEKGAEQLEEGLDAAVKTIEKIKDELPDDRAKKAVDGILGQVLQEKAKFYEKSRELSAQMKKKEFKFKSQEATLVEELRQSKALAEQKQANGDRMKQLMVEMQNKIKKEQASLSQSGNSETQFRLKLEQSQRQVELLSKEIEKLNRRAQQPATNQALAANQQQKLVSDFQKQIDIANKGLLVKKQEIEILKKQIAEKDAKEAEQKRNLLKLQNEVNAARAAAAGRKAS